MSFTESPGIAAGQRWNGQSLAEIEAQNAANLSPWKARQEAARLAEANTAKLAAINAQVAADTAFQALSRSERRDLLRDAITRHVNAGVERNTAQALLERAQDAMQAARADCVALGRVAGQVARWISEQVAQGQPTSPIPPDLERALDAATQADRHVTFVSTELENRQRALHTAEATLQQADSLRAELARRAMAGLGDELAAARRALLNDIAAIDCELTALLVSYPGGQQVPLSASARAALGETPPSDPTPDESQRGALLGWHARLLEDPAAELYEHEWLRVDDSQVQVIKAGQQ